MPVTRSQLRTRALHDIRLLVGALSRSARAVEGRTGITNAQLFVLRELAETDALSVSGLAERTLTRQSTVSTVVARLASQGLVRRIRAADDRRRLELTLTRAGRRILANAPEPPTGRLMGALNGLSTAELTALTFGLEAIARELGLAGRVAGMLFEG